MRILMGKRGYGWDGGEEEKTSRMRVDIIQGAGGQNKYRRGIKVERSLNNTAVARFVRLRPQAVPAGG